MKKKKRTISHETIKRRKTNSKKGDNGKLLIIGGSEDYTGCLALAGIAALRTGCDIVIIAAPEKTAWAINCLSPDLMTKKIKGKYFQKKHAEEIIKLSEKFDAVLIGNGIGINSKEFVKQITKKIKKPKEIILKNTTGNPGMTKAGTGDVLAGLTAGFLAQGYPLNKAALNATYINGKLGDIQKEKKGYSYIASDLIKDKEETEKIIKKIQKEYEKNINK